MKKTYDIFRKIYTIKSLLSLWIENRIKMNSGYIEDQKNIPKLTYSYHLGSQSLRKLSSHEKSDRNTLSPISPHHNKLKNILLPRNTCTIAHNSPTKHPLT